MFSALMKGIEDRLM